MGLSAICYDQLIKHDERAERTVAFARVASKQTAQGAELAVHEASSCT